MSINFKPRPSQKRILEYTGGTMGISAVPGSGKTSMLSALAAKLITDGALEYDQEILIVTLVNSAVENFASRIRQFIEGEGLAINIGYRIRTLHGLANDILRENPSLVGLENNFSIIDERDSEIIWQEIIRKWIKDHPDVISDLLVEDLDPKKKHEVHEKELPKLLKGYGIAFTRTAKDLRKTPVQVRDALGLKASALALMGLDLYDAYQRALALRGVVDFDDLIAMALTALESSPQLLARLRHRFPYILEDEAQDSSLLQEKILGYLSSGNWVRVGDPNQAVYETFTTAKPDFLIEFNRRAQRSIDLPESGRCQEAIIELANDLIRWDNTEHPDFFCRDALVKPYIQPTTADDPQPNPPPNLHGIFLMDTSFSSEGELNAVANAVSKWVENNPERTVAVLSSVNRRGSELVPMLRAKGLDVIELLSSSNDTRISASKMNTVLEYLEDPASLGRLENAAMLAIELVGEGFDPVDRQEAITLFKKIKQPEAIFNEPVLENPGASSEAQSIFDASCTMLQNWTRVVILPIDSLVITLAQDLTHDPIELALYHKLAQYLRQGNMLNSNWGLHDSIAELKKISQNERKFLGMGRQDTNFNPDLYPGKVVVTTMHKAKGLEWDKVYLMSVNNYDFPSLQDGDTYFSEKYFIRGRINVEAEGVGQLRSAFSTEEERELMTAGPTLQARRDLVRERLRLLYVGITRARREVALTWNTGRNTKQSAALLLKALRALHQRKTGK